MVGVCNVHVVCVMCVLCLGLVLLPFPLWNLVQLGLHIVESDRFPMFAALPLSRCCSFAVSGANQGRAFSASTRAVFSAWSVATSGAWKRGRDIPTGIPCWWSPKSSRSSGSAEESLMGTARRSETVMMAPIECARAMHSPVACDEDTTCAP